MGWKHNGKIEARMWDHYRVNTRETMEKQWKSCGLDV